ncbi:MAG: hypothetical protein AAB834_02040, partial [Patescibacteria group bacterium]
MTELELDWSELAFGSKKPLKDLRATFIAAPRELSAERFVQLIKEYLPQGNIVLGLSKEEYVLGLEGQPQFRTLKISTVQSVIDKVNASSAKHKLYTLSYAQRDVKFIFEKVEFKKVILINGSWYHAFHYGPEYYALAQKQIPYVMLSPFASEQEAQESAKRILPADGLPKKGLFTEREMLQLAQQAATCSFDYSGFQTAVTLGRKWDNKYKLLASAHNKVVPY